MENKKHHRNNLILCEICSRQMVPDLFYAHLSEHSREEVELLQKLSKKTMKMTRKEHRAFVSNLDLEAYRLVNKN